MAEDYRPRLAIDLTKEQQLRLARAIPWGNKSMIFNVIVEDLLTLCEKHGPGMVLGAFLERKIKLEEICKLNLKKG